MTCQQLLRNKTRVKLSGNEKIDLVLPSPPKLGLGYIPYPVSTRSVRERKPVLGIIVAGLSRVTQ